MFSFKNNWGEISEILNKDTKQEQPQKTNIKVDPAFYIYLHLNRKLFYPSPIHSIYLSTIAEHLH